MTGEKNSFQKSFRFIIITAQIFGLFPALNLKFSWLSLSVILFSAPTWILGWFCAFSHIRDMSTHAYNPYDMNGAVFNFSNGTYYLLFIILARDWPGIIAEWRKVEKSLEKYGWPKNLDLKLKTVAVVFLILETLEHLTVQVNKFIVAFECKGSVDESVQYFLAGMTFPHIFKFIPYTHALGVILQITNTRLAFCWTYVDLFIVLVSIFFAARFKQITTKIKYMKRVEEGRQENWRVVREDFNRLSNLCYEMDEKLSNLILLSFATNFYFIIFHLYRSLNVRESRLEAAYFAISFGLLILRITTVCWYGGLLHEETRKPFGLLISIPERLQNVEIGRFIEKVRYERMGISGKKFFTVTEKLIPKIGNAIVTYELILIQFNGISVTEVSQFSRCE